MIIVTASEDLKDNITTFYITTSVLFLSLQISLFVSGQLLFYIHVFHFLSILQTGISLIEVHNLL